MQSVFEYTIHRVLLKDYNEEHKAESGFTYRHFAAMTGVNSNSWLLHFIKGHQEPQPCNRDGALTAR